MKLKSVFILFVSTVLLFSIIGCKKNTSTTENSKSKFDSQKKKVSYIIGYEIGTNMRQSAIEIEMSTFNKGINDALAKVDSKIGEDEKNQVMRILQDDMLKKQQEIAEKNLNDGKKFLDKNKNEKGVVTLPSGLQYKILKDGTGPIPKASDVVSTNYVGKFIDGKEFDSSIKRGQPASFPVEGVIAGWTEALQLMKVGSKWQLFIPSELAYREQGNGEIGPNQTLIFELELLQIENQNN